MLVAEWIEQVIKVGRVGETTESISRNRGNLNKGKRKMCTKWLISRKAIEAIMRYLFAPISLKMTLSIPLLHHIFHL